MLSHIRDSITRRPLPFRGCKERRDQGIEQTQAEEYRKYQERQKEFLDFLSNDTLEKYHG